jgi:plasmid stabilization system protein ParE
VGLGIEFVHEVDRAVEAVTKAPLQFPVMHRDIRCVRVRRFPYSLFFRVEEREILVLAVFHARRSPTTWRNRK